MRNLTWYNSAVAAWSYLHARESTAFICLGAKLSRHVRVILQLRHQLDTKTNKSFLLTTVPLSFSRLGDPAMKSGRSLARHPYPVAGRVRNTMCLLYLGEQGEETCSAPSHRSQIWLSCPSSHTQSTSPFLCDLIAPLSGISTFSDIIMACYHVQLKNFGCRYKRKCGLISCSFS